MSICIISDHIIMLRQNFIVILQHIDQVKPKYEGGASAPKAPPPPPPPPPPGSAPGRESDSVFLKTIFVGVP